MLGKMLEKKAMLNVVDLHIFEGELPKKTCSI